MKRWWLLMFANTAPVIAASAWFDHHALLAISVYLAIGIIIGCVVLKCEKRGVEDPTGSLLMMMFCWGLVFPFLALLIPYLLFQWFVQKVLKVEPHYGDNR